MRDYADLYVRIAAAIEISLFVDGDTCFGGVNNVRQTVRTFEAASVSGLFISDQVFPNRCGYMEGKQIIPTATRSNPRAPNRACRWIVSYLAPV